MVLEMEKQEYVSQAGQIIRENFRENDSTGSMTAASAAYIVKHSVGDFRPVGFLKFKEVLDCLAESGEVRIGSNSKHALAIWLNGVTVKQPEPAAFKPLRKKVWYAFISTESDDRRFLSRDTGEVRFSDAPPFGDDWVEVDPISIESDRDAAKQFLADRNLDSDTFSDAISDERWFVKFPTKLADANPYLSSEWKRARSQRVVEHVRKWCEINQVDPNIVHETVVEPKARFATSGTRQSVSPSGKSEALRNALIEAIGQMSTTELLEIRIPSSHLVAALRPDLLR